MGQKAVTCFQKQCCDGALHEGPMSRCQDVALLACGLRASNILYQDSGTSCSYKDANEQVCQTQPRSIYSSLFALVDHYTMAIELAPLPLPASADASKFADFGREVKGIHPGTLTPEQFAEIQDALYKVCVSLQSVPMFSYSFELCSTTHCCSEMSS